MVKKEKVYLGLSGGVDSSVAAVLLLEQGYSVIPVFMKCWENNTLDDCPWQEDQDAAYAVAEKLGIASEFRSWNFEREFFQDVVQYLVDEARQGRTGNPDVVCNRTIKFGAFLERALREGADYVATGHYARITQTDADRTQSDWGTQTYAERFRAGPRKVRVSPRFELLRPRCEWKNDQTYFLWQLTQQQLKHVLFPIGDFVSKDAVREEARRRGFATADRRSTRGICFVGKTPLTEFLGRFLPETPGPVVTTSGKVVGEHRGVNFYTLGQRKGIGVGDAHGPYYVAEKDAASNTLVVAPPAEMARIEKREIVVGDLHWTSGKAPKLPLRCSAYIRHPQPLQACVLSQNNAKFIRQRRTGAKPRKTILRSSARGPRWPSGGSALFRVRFEEPQWAPTPGQSVVFYDGDIVLGGGVIQ